MPGTWDQNQVFIFLSYHSYIYLSDTTLSSGRLSTCTFKDLLASGGEVGVGHSTISSDIPGVPKNSKKASLNIV